MQGDYLLLAALGGEPDCQVFRARSRRDGHIVAVRVIQQSQLTVFGSQPIIGKAEVASHIVHPALTAVEAYGQESDDTWFIVTEYVEGPRLDEWADSLGIPPLVDLIDMIHRVCHALHAAHRAGLVHDSLHPGNLIVLPRLAKPSAPLDIKLLDLSVPALVRPWPPQLRAALFMPPEQLTLDDLVASSADVRGNVYSCGALLYYLCTGGPPYHSRNLDELAAQHREGRLVAPSKINPRIPTALEEAILRALAPDPRLRFPSAAELANALALIRLPIRLSGARSQPPSQPAPRSEAWVEHADFAEFPSDSQAPQRASSSQSLPVPKASVRESGPPGTQIVTQRHPSPNGGSIRPPLGSFSSPPPRDSSVGLAGERVSSSSFFPPAAAQASPSSAPAASTDDSSADLGFDEPQSSPTLILQPGELQEVSAKYPPLETLEPLEPLEAPEQSLDEPTPSYRLFVFTHWLNLCGLSAAAIAGAAIGPVVWMLAAFVEGSLLFLLPDVDRFRSHVEERTAAVRLERERVYYLKQLFGLQERKKGLLRRLLGLFVEQGDSEPGERIIDQKHEGARVYHELCQLVGELKKIADMRGASVVAHEQLLDRMVNRYLGLLLIRRLLATAAAGIDRAALAEQIERVEQQLTHATPEARVVLHESLTSYRQELAKLAQLQSSLHVGWERMESTRRELRELHLRVMGDSELDIAAVLDDWLGRKTIAADPFAEMRTERLLRELLIRPHN